MSPFSHFKVKEYELAAMEAVKRHAKSFTHVAAGTVHIDDIDRLIAMAYSYGPISGVQSHVQQVAGYLSICPVGASQLAWVLLVAEQGVLAARPFSAGDPIVWREHYKLGKLPFGLMTSGQLAGQSRTGRVYQEWQLTDVAEKRLHEMLGDVASTSAQHFEGVIAEVRRLLPYVGCRARIQRLRMRANEECLRRGIRPAFEVELLAKLPRFSSVEVSLAVLRKRHRAEGTLFNQCQRI